MALTNEQRAKFIQQIRGKQTTQNVSSVDDFNSRIDNSLVNPVPKRKRFSDILGFPKGLLKGAGSTITGAGRLLDIGVSKLTGQKPLEHLKEKPDFLIPKTGAEKLGFTVEQIVEFLAPIPGAKVSKVAKAKGAFSLFKKSLSQAIDFAGRTAIQTGGDVEDIKQAGIIGGAAPPVFRGISLGIKKIAPVIGDVLSSVLGNFIGKDPSVVKRAFENPVAVANKVKEGVIPLEIRLKAVKQLNKFKEFIGNNFETELEKLRKLTPRVGTTRDIAGKFTGVKSAFKQMVENSTKTGLPKIFRDFRISLSDGKINFDKLNSAIVKTSEQTKIKKVFETIKGQKDFSAKGVQDIAARINALSKFTEGAATQSSAVITGIHKAYSKAIDKIYPELGALRSQYGADKEIISGIDSVLKSVKNDVADPGAVTSAVKKLSNVWKEDNEAYIAALQRFEKKTGTNLLNELAATEFVRTVPASFGSRVAQAGLVAGGIFYNPALLAILPLFSPKLVGKITTGAGRATKTLQKAKGALPKISEPERIIPPLLREK